MSSPRRPWFIMPRRPLRPDTDRFGIRANDGATAPVVNTVAPVASGSARTSQTLSASDGTWTGPGVITYSYQWQSSANGSTGWANVGGATSSTYAIPTGATGNYYRCVVTGTNGTSDASANSNTIGPIVALLGFLQGAAETTASASTTFASQNLGSADANRYIVVCSEVLGASVTSFTSITVGGIAATIAVQRHDGARHVAIAIAAVPNGTSGDVVVTVDNTKNRSAIQLYRAVGIASATAVATGSSIANPGSGSINVSAGGFAIACGATNDASSFTWSGLTEDYDSVVAGFNGTSSASREFSSAQTPLAITATPSGGGASLDSVYASWA